MCSIKRGITLLYYLCKWLFLDDFNLEEINFHCFGSLEEKSKLKKNYIRNLLLLIWLLFFISYKYITIAFNLYLSIYIRCLSVCLFFCIQWTSKRLNRSGPNFVWDLTWPQGKFIFKIHDFFLIHKLFCYCFTTYTKRKFPNWNSKSLKYIYTYLYLSVGLFVCFWPINAKTAEPIGSTFFVGHQVTTGKVYGKINLREKFL